MMRSLQTRLLIGLAAGTALVLVVSGLLLFQLIRAELYHEFDVALANEARALAALVEEVDGRIQTEIAEHNLTGFQSGNNAVLYSIRSHDGTVLEQSKGLDDVAITHFGGTIGEPQFQPIVLSGHVAGRMVAMRFTPHRDNEDVVGQAVAGQPDGRHSKITLIVARDTRALQATLVRITWLLVGVFGSAILILILLAWPIVRASLHPLQRISAQIETMDTNALHQRLDVAKAPDEVTAVVDCLNDLLCRLHDAFQREKAFSANVAHELRTPLAGLRTTIDVALAKPVESADDRRALARCLTICKQAHALTENLLTLARLDSNQCQRQQETLSLDALLREAWTPLAPQAEARGLDVIWAVHESVRLTSDSTLLSLIIRNLFDNAVSYADKAGHIEVRAGADDSIASVEIRNTASGLPADLEQHVFDRFWRGDKSRSGNGAHAGLGMSLCREAAKVLGATLSVTVQDEFLAVNLQVPAVGPERAGNGHPGRSTASQPSRKTKNKV